MYHERIQKMMWGADGTNASQDAEVTKNNFFSEWERLCAQHDPLSWVSCGGEDGGIYAYLNNKLDEILHSKKKIGPAGWRSQRSSNEHRVACVVWADGSHCQETPSTVLTGNEQWWPCLVLIDNWYEELVPFMCPALVGRLLARGLAMFREFTL